MLVGETDISVQGGQVSQEVGVKHHTVRTGCNIKCHNLFYGTKLPFKFGYPAVLESILVY